MKFQNRLIQKSIITLLIFFAAFNFVDAQIKSNVLVQVEAVSDLSSLNTSEPVVLVKATNQFYTRIANTWVSVGSGGGGSDTGGIGKPSGGVSGSILFVGSDGNIKEDNSNLYYDDATDRLRLADSLTKGLQFGTISGNFGGRFMRDGSVMFLGIPSAGQFQIIDSNGISLMQVLDSGKVKLGAAVGGVGTDAQLLTYVTDATRPGIVAQLAPSQTADGFQQRDSSGNINFKVDKNGNVMTKETLNFSANDAGLARNGAGLVRITDGSTGLGRIITGSKTPASQTDPCEIGEQAWNVNFYYVCVNTNFWKRVALSTW